MNIADITSVINSVFVVMTFFVTLGGMYMVYLQLKHSNRVALDEFEHNLDTQYRDLMLPIPVAILLGDSKKLNDIEYEKVREFIYNYYDLSNEQCFLFKRGKISERTWNAWRSGMKSHLKKPVFNQVILEIIEHNPFDFTFFIQEFSNEISTLKNRELIDE